MIAYKGWLSFILQHTIDESICNFLQGLALLYTQQTIDENMIVYKVQLSFILQHTIDESIVFYMGPLSFLLQHPI